MDLLIQHKANVNAQGMNGMTPLHIAVDNNDQLAIEKLLFHRADPNEKIMRVTPLFS